MAPHPTVFLPHMIQDPLTAHEEDIKPADGFECDLESSYYDGPVSDRVAVLDFDARTGRLGPGTRYLGVPKRLKQAVYDVPRKPAWSDVYTREFNNVSVFATILRTMKLFQNPYRIGRELAWRNGRQLLVVPRAGEWGNAFYDRETNSLNFFFFPSRHDPQQTIYTSLSRDIVVHETAHAILDGIAPDLIDRSTPESLAIHEALADFTTLLLAFESGTLVEKVLHDTHGGIEDSTAFSSVADEFVQALQPERGATALRNLFNSRCMDEVPGQEPHELSEVLSGALYSVLMLVHAEHRHTYSKQPPAKGKPDPWFSCSGKALKAAGFRVGNSALRALDYLPPGCLSFADYGRALLAVDETGQLNPPHVREWLRQEFVLRNMVLEAKDLAVPGRFTWAQLDDLDVDALVQDDAVARRFVEQNRAFLEVPPRAAFDVLPRLRTRKVYYGVTRNENEVEECLLKVRWSEDETGGSRGSTLALDIGHAGAGETRKPKPFVRLLLVGEGRQAHAARRARLQRLAEAVRAPAPAPTPERRPASVAVPVSVAPAVSRPTSTGARLDALRVRAYNVGFGDALLVSIPDLDHDGRTRMRHILIDVGTAPGRGSERTALVPVVRNILEELQGEPLDLYVMTHEHMDHVQGLLYAVEHDPSLRIKVRHAWLTASSDKRYGDAHPDARKERLALQERYLALQRLVASLRAADAPVPATLAAMMLNNDWQQTDKCVAHLAGLAEHTHYVHRETVTQGCHPFEEAQLRIWAPEADTSVYYGRFRPLSAGAPDADERVEPLPVEPLEPPPGVDREAFERYLRLDPRSCFEALLAIDAAANNTSVVLSIEWRGWHLLFPGDAEVRSWKQMNKAGLLKQPVHFLKLAHHGSRNGMPPDELLDALLPLPAPDDRPRTALLSASPEGEAYQGVPSATVLAEIKQRVAELRTVHEEAEPGGYIDLMFPDPASAGTHVPARAEPAMP